MNPNRGFNSNYQSGKLKDGRYVYYPADGKPVYLTPGDDVSADIILLLDGMDHDTALTDRNEKRHRDTNTELEKKEVSDRNHDSHRDVIENIPDPNGDVFSLLFPDSPTTSPLLSMLKTAMKKLTPNQIDFIYDRFGLQMTTLEIAERDHVSHQAINNRQNKIFKRLKKLIEEQEAT